MRDSDMTSRIRMSQETLAVSPRPDPISHLGFAVVIPLGPAETECCRLSDFLESLLFFESECRWVVIVDDGEPGRPVPIPHVVTATCSVVTLRNPCNGQGDRRNGGLCAGVLKALQWLSRNCAPDFVLKADTDSLIIGQFSERILAFFQSCPSVGVAGVLGRTCDRASPLFRQELFTLSPLASVYDTWTAFRTLDLPWPPPRHFKIDQTRYVPGDRLSSFASVGEHIGHAVRNGLWQDIYCQGGGYVISPIMLRRMSRQGFLSVPEHWAFAPFGEDQIIGMYAHAVEMSVADLSDDGDPFGVQWCGLPYPPEALLARGHAIIHSVKSDARYSESEIRRFFAEARSPRPVIVRQQSSSQSEELRYYADLETAELAERGLCAVLLGCPIIRDFGDLLRLRANVSLYESLYPGHAVCFLTPWNPATNRKAFRLLRSACAPACLIVASRADLPDAVLRSVQMTPLRSRLRCDILHNFGNIAISTAFSRRWLKFVRANAKQIEHELYILSGQDCAPEDSEALVRHTRESRAALVGCSESDLVDNVVMQGIAACISGEDTVDSFGPKSPHPRGTPKTEDAREIGVELAPAERLWLGEKGVNIDGIDRFHEGLLTEIAGLRDSYGRRPLFVETGLDWGDGRGMSFASWRCALGQVYPHSIHLDIGVVVLKAGPGEAARVVEQYDLGWFLATSFCAALFFAHNGIPTFLRLPGRRGERELARLGLNWADRRVSTVPADLSMRQSELLNSEIGNRAAWRSLVRAAIG